MTLICFKICLILENSFKKYYFFLYLIYEIKLNIIKNLYKIKFNDLKNFEFMCN